MTQNNHQGSGRAYADICGDLVAHDCAVQLLDQKDAGQPLPPMPDSLRLAIETDQGSVAIAILADLQQVTHTETTTSSTYANAQPARTLQPEDLSFPVPLLILGAVGLAAVGIKAAAERFYGPNEDDLDRELEAWEKQLGGFEPIADLPEAQPEATSSPNPSPALGSPQLIQPIHLAATQPKTFDWTELQDFNRHPHILILGKTGAGKTTLARRLLSAWGGHSMVITPHVKPGDWDTSIQVKGAGRNYSEIGRALDGLVAEMNRRYQLYAAGIDDYPAWFVVLDETSSIIAKCANAGAQLTELVREARKVKIRLIVLAHGMTVKELGCEGEGAVRESYTQIRLRGFLGGMPQSVAAQLAEFDYPALVNGMVADVDQLPDLATTTALPGDCEPSVEAKTTVQRQRLEALYKSTETESQPSHTGRNQPLYTPDRLTAEQAIERIQQLRQSGLNQTKTIETLWAVKAGSNAPYHAARSEYRTLMGE
jgi:hypothetical protein